MPRDGSNIYSQPFPDVVEDTTIESTVYNGFTNDVAADLNAARPIVAGGTGATNAHDAMIALSGDIARQVVTNYDSHPFVSGSFYSVGGTTSEPVAGLAFAGACYVYDADTRYMTLTGYIQNDAASPGRRYVRQKTAAGWSAWVHQAGSYDDVASAGDARYVNVTGDIMTGPLAVNNVVTSAFTATTGTYYFGSSGTKYLTYDGTNFSIGGGPFLAPSLTALGQVTSHVSTTTGTYYFGGSGTKYLTYNGTNFNLFGGTYFLVDGSVVSVQSATTGTYYFGSNVNKYLQYDGTSFNLIGGSLIIHGGAIVANDHIVAGNSNANRTLYFGSAGTKYLTYDGTNFTLAGGTLALTNSVWAAGEVNAGTASPTVGTFRFGNNSTKFLQYDGGKYLFGGVGDATTGVLIPGIYGHPGIGNYTGTNMYNFYWSNPNLQLWIDFTNVGNVSYTSDYRTKKDVIDLPGMWDTVKALRPIKYTQAEFSPPSHIEHINGLKTKEVKEGETPPVIPGHLFEADDIERWGFIAHELQETLTPSAASAEKDSPDSIQSPNPFTLIAALTKALQEAMARIEALEAR